MAAEQNSADWSTSYTQFLSRSAALSARSLKLYQEALERVSQGKLPPTVFQDHLPRFVQAHAAEYTTRVAEVGAHFLSEVMRLGASVAQQPPDSQTATEPKIVPPRFDVSNPSRWFEQLGEYAGQLNARAMKAYRTQLDRVAAGETTPSEAQHHSTDYLARQLPDYLQQMTQLYMDLLGRLNDIRTSYEETYFRGMLASANREESEVPVSLTLTGFAGAIVTASLSVTNTTAHRTAIVCQITDVRRSDGIGPAFVPALVIFPETLELAPDEEGTLTVSLHLDPQQYDPGASYTGALHISGGPDLQVEVQLRILIVEEASNHSQAQGSA